MTGHGHVIPNADGSRARCGGPTMCTRCATEFARHGAAEIEQLRRIVEAVEVAVRGLSDLHIEGDDAAAHNWNAAIALAESRLRAASGPAAPEPSR